MQEQVPELWMRTACNNLLTVVRNNYANELDSAAEDIEKDLVGRLIAEAVYQRACESSQKVKAFSNFLTEFKNAADS